MGYRTYIGKLSKSEYDEVKDLTKEELFKRFNEEQEDGWVGPYEIAKILYEFGKYTEFDDNKFYKPFFTNEDLQNWYVEEHDFWVVGKDYLEHIINYYRDKIRTYYKEMLEPFHTENELTSKFLNSIKKHYGYSKDKYTFDLSLITDEEQTALFKLIEHIRSMGREWGAYSFLNMQPYDLEDGPEVTTSWKYEYNIFELVRIYKTFDWENDILVYYGY